MKGYILSVSALLLFSVVISFARNTESIKQQMKDSYHNAVQISKLKYFINDISEDLGNLILVNYMTDNTSASTYNISIIDNMAINKSQFLSYYPTFLQGYGNITGANISFSYSDPLIVNFNNGMQYSSTLNGTSMSLKNSTGTSPITNYSISIVANAPYTTYTEFNWEASGTYVTIQYSDTSPPHTFTKSGYINSSLLNQFTINFSSDNAIILAGLVDGAGNAIEVNQTLPGHLSSITINSMMTEALPIAYNPSLNISILNANYTSNVPA
jgi:hypothetical protein